MVSSLSIGAFTVFRIPAKPHLLEVKQGNVVRATNIIIETCRAWLIGKKGADQWDEKVHYNYNAAIRMAKFVASQIPRLHYQVPTDLAGQDTDNDQIIPDEIVMGIVLLQAARGISIDGQAGGGFIKGVMGKYGHLSSEAAMIRFMKEEEENDSWVDAAGKRHALPDFSTASEAVLYDFFAGLVAARNGLWSTRHRVTNIVSLRRELDPSNSTDYNDTLALCWQEQGEAQATKHCQIFVGTTEPGERRTQRQLVPQTCLSTLGLHKGRQPGGRISHILVESGEAAGRKLSFETTDCSGFNFHPGGFNRNNRGGMALENEQLKGIPGEGGAMNDRDFRIHHLLSEIFYLLGKWGANRQQAAFKFLMASRNSPEGSQDIERISALFEHLKHALHMAGKSSAAIASYVDYIQHTVQFNQVAEKAILSGVSHSHPTLTLKDGATEVNTDVGASSEGCQVIFGGAQFYKFWWAIQQFALETGQRRWYYNLVDITRNYEAI